MSVVVVAVVVVVAAAVVVAGNESQAEQAWAKVEAVYLDLCRTQWFVAASPSSRHQSC